jgi:hypothetical protein
VNKFEYLSVLVSIIIGLAVSNLLSGAARLIQLRARVRLHATTLCWMAILFLINIQVWWAAFDRRYNDNWTFFAFLLFLMIPIILSINSYLVLPDLGDEDSVDPAANFHDNRAWFFGLLAAVPVVSLVDQVWRSGHLPMDLDALFRVVFTLQALVAARIANARYQLANAVGVLLLFLGYVAVLFLRLR